MDREPHKKDCWDKLRILAIVAIPVAVAAIGWWVNSTLAEQELQVKYVEIAVGILSQPPNAEQDAAPDALREWAIDVLVAKTPVTLTGEAIENMRRNALPVRFLGTESGLVITTESGEAISLE